MKVRVLERFYDREQEQIREEDTVFECEKKRGEYLIMRGLAEAVKEAKKQAPAKKPKK